MFRCAEQREYSKHGFNLVIPTSNGQRPIRRESRIPPQGGIGLSPKRTQFVLHCPANIRPWEFDHLGTALPPLIGVVVSSDFQSAVGHGLARGNSMAQGAADFSARVRFLVGRSRHSRIAGPRTAELE